MYFDAVKPISINQSRKSVADDNLKISSKRVKDNENTNADKSVNYDNSWFVFLSFSEIRMVNNYTEPNFCHNYMADAMTNSPFEPFFHSEGAEGD